MNKTVLPGGSDGVRIFIYGKGLYGFGERKDLENRTILSLLISPERSIIPVYLSGLFVSSFFESWRVEK